MWGVIARVVAAAAVISVIQHTATQIYNGWREDQDRHETQVGPQQLLAPRKGDDVEGDDDDDGRKDSGGGERSGGSGGSSRSFSSASAAAAAAAAARGENSRGGQFGEEDMECKPWPEKVEGWFWTSVGSASPYAPRALSRGGNLDT